MAIKNNIKKYKRLIRSDSFQSKLKKITLPGFEGIPVYDVIQQFKEEVKNDDLSIRASSISFYFILALLPSIIFFFSVIPYLPIENVDEKIIHGLRSILPNSAFSILETTIRDIVSIQNGGILSINFFLAMFVASNGVNSMMKAFDKMNETFKERNWWQKRLAAIRILVLVSFQIIIAVLLIVKGKELLMFILKLLKTDKAYILLILRIVKMILIIFSFFNIIAMIYYYGPSVKQKYKYFSVGATFATLFSILMTYGFQVYAAYLNNFNRLFGSLGIVIVIMMLIYLNALVLLFGFELNNSIALNKNKAQRNLESENS